MTPLPASLFKDGFMRKPTKAQLANELRKNVCLNISEPQSAVTVVDGGFLLHSVKWPPNSTYDELAKLYEMTIRTRYGCCVQIVFDGYPSGPTIKDHERKRRATKFCHEIRFEGSMLAHKSQAEFLSISRNKERFVSFLHSHFLDCGFLVIRAHDDADTLIVKTALEIASTGQSVLVVANDTDVLVLLLYHFKPHIGEIFFRSEVPSRRINRCVTVSVAQISQTLGATAVSKLLLMHSFSGCDTTSALYGHGKRSIFRIFHATRFVSTCACV